MNQPERNVILWQIVTYSLLVTAIAWIAPILGGSPEEPGPGFILWGTAPLLVAVLMRYGTRDWTNAGARPEFVKNIVWYVISALAYPVIMVLALLAGVLISITSVTGFSAGQYLQTALIALPFFVVFAIFEEVGWRGYLAPKLASLGINSYVAAALLAVIWTAWHVPYLRELMWVYGGEDLLPFIPRYYLVLFAFSILYGEIRQITGTFWPAVLMHATSNAFGHPLAADYVTLRTGTEYLGSVSTGLFIIAFTLVLGVVITRWRMQEQPLQR